MKKILIIEDTPEILENLTEYLEMNGYKVFAALNGTKGVELATTLLPDLIICDALMADLDGFEVLRILKKTTVTSSIPFIFSTSLSERIDKAEALALGAVEYLVKPFELNALLTIVELWINPNSRTAAAH